MWLRPAATPDLASASQPPPHSLICKAPFSGVGAPFSEQQGFPWSCAATVAWPVSGAWFPFAE